MSSAGWMIALVTLVGASWLLLVPWAAERILPRWPAARHHRLHFVALVSFSCWIVAGAAWIVPTVATPEAALPSPAEFLFTAMGKFRDLRDAPAAASAPAQTPLLPLLAATWIAGMALCLARLGSRWVRLVRLVARARAVEDRRLQARVEAISRRIPSARSLRLRVSREIGSPMIWGPPFAVLLLPPSWAQAVDARLRMLLAHELAHLQRRDSLKSLAVELLCAVAWFHPLVWRTARRLQELQEHCADQQVLAQGFRASDYGAFLLDTARRGLGNGWLHPAPAASILGPNPLHERMRRVLEPPAPRGRGGPARASMLLGLAIAPAAASLWLSTVAAGAAEAAPAWTPEAIDAALNPVFVNKMQDLHVAGAAISIVHGGKKVYEKGWGRAEVFGPRPVVADRTIFRIGSVSKVITGVAVMQLVDRGLLELDADVNRYLKEFQVEDRFDEPVRLRHLLTHTAGFDQLGYGRHADSPDAVRPLGEFLAENLVRIRPPGELSCYDTYAVTLAGHLVEVVSGQSYEDYVTEHIFRPLQMHRSSITVPAALSRDVAVGYEFRGEWYPQDWEYMNTAPASTINSTVGDMANFAAMMLAGGEFRGRHVLSRESVDEMLRLQHTNDPRLPGFGLTFWQDRSFRIDAFSHGGSMTGYGCFLYLVPQEDLGVFVAYNQESGGLASLAIAALVQTFLADGMRTPEERPTWQGDDGVGRFVGTYADAMHNHTRPDRGGWRRRPFDLTLDAEGHLMFHGQPCRRVDRLAFEREDGLLLVFREDAGGNVTHLLVQQTVYERLADPAS